MEPSDPVSPPPAFAPDDLVRFKIFGKGQSPNAENALILGTSKRIATLQVLRRSANGEVIPAVRSLPWKRLDVLRLEGRGLEALLALHEAEEAKAVRSEPEAAVSPGAVGMERAQTETASPATAPVEGAFEAVFESLAAHVGDHGLGHANRATLDAWSWHLAVNWEKSVAYEPLLARRQALVSFLSNDPRRFVARVNGMLEATTSSQVLHPDVREWAIAFIGLAWSVLKASAQRLPLSDMNAEGKRLLAQALEVDRSSVRLPSFWIETEPLPGTEDEHGRAVKQAYLAHVARCTWKEIRLLGFELVLHPAKRQALKRAGITDVDLRQLLLDKWIKTLDLSVFGLDPDHAFGLIEQIEAKERVLARLKDLDAALVPELLAVDGPFWQVLDADSRTRAMATVQDRLPREPALLEACLALAMAERLAEPLHTQVIELDPHTRLTRVAPPPLPSP